MRLRIKFHSYLNRWISFAACCIIQCSAGLNYVFSVFAPELKAKFHFHEGQIAAVGSAFNFGGYFAVPAGLLYDRVERNKRMGMWVGCLLLTAGYGGLWACAKGHIQPTFARVLFFAFLGGNSSTWFDTSCIVTSVRNFPHDRGTVVGILKAFVGLSASIYSSVYAAAFEPHALRFLAFIALVPPSLNLLASLLVNLVPEAYHEPTLEQLQQQERLEQQQDDREQQQQEQQQHGHGQAGKGGVGASEGGQQVSRPQRQRQRRHRRKRAEERLPAVGTAARFMGLYCLVAVLALYQTGAALSRGLLHLGPTACAALAGGVLALLSLVLLVPVASGDILHTKPRADALERAHSVGGVGGSAAAVPGDQPAPAAPAGDVSGDSRLREPLLPSAAAAAPTGPGAGAGPRGGRSAGGGAAADEEEAEEAEEKRLHQAEQEALEALEEVPALPNLAAQQVVRTPEFWLLLLQFSVGLGTGLAFLNNLGSIVRALGGPNGGQDVFVSLFSVANATGRLLGGMLSEHYLRKYGTPRPVLLLVASVMMLVGVGGCAASQLEDLYGTSLLAGLAFGAHWSIIPATIADLFGLQHYGSNYTTAQLGPAFVSYLLATVLTGALYDRAARRHGDGLFCVGADCYFETWCVLAVLNVAAIAATRTLLVRTRPTYARIYAGL